MTVKGLLSATCEVVGSVLDGQSLFDAARQLKPDLIVTDISMPILNGIEASRRLNEGGCTAKIIFLTAHSGSDFVHSCLATGALGFVEKSRMLCDLLPAIQKALAGHVFISPTSSIEASL